VRLVNGLLLLSVLVFALTGIAYLVAPGAALSIVGIESAATSDFLLRTESVALLSAAGLIWAVKDAGVRPVRIALVALAVYYVLGSIIDLAAFRDGVVGAASVPSAAVRIFIGGLCLVAVSRSFAFSRTNPS